MRRGRRTAGTLRTQGDSRTARGGRGPEEGKPTVQLIGSYPRVRGGGRFLAWTQDDLTSLFGGF